MMLHRFLLAALLASGLILPQSAVGDSASGSEDEFVVDDKYVEDDAAVATEQRAVTDALTSVADDVEGRLSIGDYRFFLRYGYAIEEQRLAGALQAGELANSSVQGSDPRVVIFLTDEPIPDSARGSIAKIHRLVNNGAFHGLEITVDPALGKPRWTGRLLLGGDQSNQVFRLRQRASNKNNNNFQLEDFERDGDVVSGRLFVNRSFPRFNIDGQETTEKFSFKVKFEDLIADPAPKATNVLSGAKARKTPQAEILVSAIDALREGDSGRFQAVAATNSEIAFLVRGPNRDAYLNDLLNDLPTTAEGLRESISRIVFFGDRAIMLTDSASGLPREFIFQKESGQWKLSQG
jgi:hypothetical protein